MIRHRTPKFPRQCGSPAAEGGSARRGGPRARRFLMRFALRGVPRSCRALAVGLVWGWGLLAALVAAAPEDAFTPPPYRYLFIVDLSRDLANEAEAIKRTVFELIRGGFDGQARPGDLCGIWTLTDTVNTQHSPPVTWRADLRQSFADHALRFLNAQRWRGGARYDLALAALSNAVHRSPVLTVFLFTARPFPVPNAPFSASLDAFYRRVTADPKMAQRTFATVLTSREGNFVSAEVSFIGDPIRVPPVEPGQADSTGAKPPAAAEASPVPAPALGATGTKLQRKRPLALTSPAAYETAAAEKPLIDVEALLAAARQSAKATDKPAENVVESPANASGADQEYLPPAEVRTGRSEVFNEPLDTAPPPSQKHQAAPPHRPQLDRLLAVLPEFLFTGLGFVVVAGGLGLAAIFLALIVARPKRPDERPSLISQSIDRSAE